MEVRIPVITPTNPEPEVFPLELLNPQIERVERKEIHGTYIDLYEDQNKQIKKTILDKYSNRAILNHPIDPKSKNKEGVIQIWEITSLFCSLSSIT